MPEISGVDDNDETERKINGIILNFMYMSELNNIPIIPFEQLKQRLGAIDEVFLITDIIKFYDKSEMIDITEKYEFMLTDKGRKEARNRIAHGRLW